MFFDNGFPMSIITPAQLLDIQANQVCKVLFTSKDGSGPGKRPPLVLAHPNTYIPQSLFFDLEQTFSDSESEISTTMVDVEAFERGAGNLGLCASDTVVIYDDYGNFYASRVWFMFKTMGHKNVYVLDGGLHNWLIQQLPTVHTLIQANKRTDYVASPSSEYRFVTKDTVKAAINKRHYAIIDARSHARFTAEETETRPNLRSGHIPSSTNMHYASFFDSNSCFVEQAQLSHLFNTYRSQALIFTCGSGVTACILAQAADLVGISPLYVYDGSWSEWGSDNTLPIS